MSMTGQPTKNNEITFPEYALEGSDDILEE